MEISSNNPGPWHIPQRQSPAAIFIILGKTSLQLLKSLWPVLVVYFFKDEEDNFSGWLIWFISGFGILSLLGTLTTYWFSKFYIRENHLMVQSGLLMKKNLSIPFRNIQAVHLEQNVWQQLLGVSKVSFDATGSEQVEVKLDALETGKAIELKKLLMEEAQSEPGKETASEKAADTYKISFTDLLKLSITANHFEAFFILLAFSYNIVGEIKQIFDFDEQEYFDTYAREMLSQTSYLIFMLMLVIATISLLFSIIRTFIKFFDFSLLDNQQSWRITFGLFNRQQKTIPLNKIQIISWRSSWLRRKLDYWIILVQSVGHGKQPQKQHDQIPIFNFLQAVKLVGSYQEFSGIDPDQSNSLQPDYWKRNTLIVGSLLALIPILASFYWIEWWSLAFLLLFIYTSGHYYAAWKHFRWQTVPAGLQILSGVWGRKYTLLNWSKVQQVHIHQSPYQRKNGLANLSFLTAGGKVVLPYLHIDTATALADMVLYEVESRNENWM